MNKPVLLTLIFSVLVVFSLTPAIHAQPAQVTIELGNRDELTLDVYGNNKKLRILWLASSHGFNERHTEAARLMAKHGMEVWQVDLIENLFLPKGAESIRTVPGKLVAGLIEKLSEQGKYKILVMSTGYGSIPALRGIHQWQDLKQKQARLVGLVLFGPYLYTHVPELGNRPELVPVTYATNIPVYIFQEEKNGNYPHFPEMHNALQKHATVYTQIIRGATSIFYDKDTARETMDMLDKLPVKIKNAISLLEKYDIAKQPIMYSAVKNKVTNSGLNVDLAPYRGNVSPSTIRLKDANHEDFVLDNFKGKVTLVNFWATWCTPCIEEIPSLNRLKQKMKGKPFRLISINYAEESGQIHSFMKQVKVDFPVLLDIDSKIARQWKVVAFPSTFVVGTDGKIHYGVNAAIHWDTEQVIQQLENLMH